MTTKSRIIFALGGGSHGEHRDTYTNWRPESPSATHFPITTTPVDKHILGATGKQRPHILLILTASEDGKHNLTLFEQAFRKQYEGLGATVDSLRLITEKPSIEAVKAKFARANAVYVSGGNTWRMMQTWRRLGIDALLRQAYENGVVMSGVSAGSICWFRYGTSNSFYSNKPFRVAGLGWFDLTVCPHYDVQPFRQPALKNMLRRSPQMIGIALDEQAALEIRDNTYRSMPCSLGQLHNDVSGKMDNMCYKHSP